MKLGKVTSCVGDMAVVSPPDREGPISLEAARRLSGKAALSDGKFVGKVFDVIGRVDSPLIVVRLSPKFLARSNLVGKLLQTK